MPPTNDISFEAALGERVEDMLDACTRCGKCVEVCPATEAAGLTVEQRQDPVHVIDGIIDIVRHGEGNEAARKWASGCLLSGECIKACDYGVNPRFLLYMARIEMAHAKETVAQRRDGVEAFRKVAVEVKHLSQMQLDGALLARLLGLDVVADFRSADVAAGGEPLRSGDEVGRLLTARWAPRRPLVDHQRLAAVIGKRHRLARQRREVEVRRGRTDLRSGQRERGGDDDGEHGSVPIL